MEKEHYEGVLCNLSLRLLSQLIEKIFIFTNSFLKKIIFMNNLWIIFVILYSRWNTRDNIQYLRYILWCSKQRQFLKTSLACIYQTLWCINGCLLCHIKAVLMYYIHSYIIYEYICIHPHIYCIYMNLRSKLWSQKHRESTREWEKFRQIIHTLFATTWTCKQANTCRHLGMHRHVWVVYRSTLAHIQIGTQM